MAGRGFDLGTCQFMMVDVSELIWPQHIFDLPNRPGVPSNIIFPNSQPFS